MKTIRILATLLLTCMITQLSAKDILTGSYGESIRWRLTDKGELIISGNGALASYGNWTIDGDEQPIDKRIKWEYDDEGNGTIVENPFPKDKVKKITFDGQLTNLKAFFKWSFPQCTQLAVKGIDELKAVDGLLYTTDGTTLAHFPAGIRGEYTVPEGVTKIGEEAFMGSRLATVHLPSTLRKLGDAVFVDTSIEEIIIPEGVDTLPIGTFQHCKNLRSITLPSTVQEVFWMTSWCPALERIEVSPANLHLSSLDGVLYDKEMTWVYNYPEGKKDPVYQMPETVIGLENASLCNCKLLEQVIFSPAMYWIGPRAFSQCDKLRSAVLPEGVYHISSGAFEYCTSLTELTIPSTVQEIDGRLCDGSGVTRVIWNAVQCDKKHAGKMFAGAPLTEVVIGKDVQVIPDDIFYGAKGLTRLHIPASVTAVGADAFYGCTGVKELQWDAENCEDLRQGMLISHADDDTIAVQTVRFGKAVKRIPNGLCKGFTELKSVTIPASVISIGKEAFSGCTALADIQMGSGVRTIGDRAFAGTAIRNFTFPEYLMGCGHELFADCSNLTSITWNAIACDAFDQNNTLFYSYDTSTKQFPYNITQQIKSVNFGSKVELVPNYFCAFLNNVTSFRLPASLLGIGRYAFAKCISLEQITIPANVSFIREAAFMSCDTLSTVVLPANLKQIRPNTFRSCKNLRDILLPASLREIGSFAFCECLKLQSIVLPDKLRILGEEAYAMASSQTPIVIPASVDSMGSAVFGSVDAPAIEVDEHSQHFSAKGGILYNKDKTVVLACPRTMKGKIKLASSVQIIPLGAFAYSQAETVELPGKLTTIEPYSFLGSWITSITIPKDVQKIPQNAFKGCTLLREAKFKNKNVNIEDGAFEPVTSFTF